MVRLKDIAARAGVSIMTVSKALRAEKDVAAATRERIRYLARQMGYVPDSVAQGFRSRTTKLFGVVISSLANPIFKGRLVGVGHLNLAGCMALGITGPVLRAAGLPYDVRKHTPYCGYETYDFDVPTSTDMDSYSRVVLRIEECYQSLRIVEQALDRLQAMGPGPVMVADKKIAWPAQLAIGSDGMGNSLDHIRQIMGTSMEALIHHFKLVTEGFRVPAGQVWQSVEAPRGELGVHLVSDGGTRPYRAHFRDPSFNNLQAVSIMCEGGLLADVVVAVAGLDPVLGGVDR